MQNENARPSAVDLAHAEIDQHYINLKELVSSGKLTILHIVSTPRSSSTALERALYQADDIDLQINDPWANYDSDSREQDTYRQIVREVEASMVGKQKIKIIIKSVADYIPPGDAFIRICGLSQHTLVLSRNPFLQMESMMKIMAESIKPSDVLVGSSTMDEYSRSRGYHDWTDMRDKVISSRNYTELESIYSSYFPIEQEIHQSQTMRLSIIQNLSEDIFRRIGFLNADEFAKSKGFSDFDHLLGNAQLHPEVLNNYSDLLQAIFLCRITGWDAMRQHVDQMEKKSIPFTVVDSTLYRAFPDYYLSQLADITSLTFDESMIDWNAKVKHFEPGDDEGVSYYQKVITSSGVLPPSETPVAFEKFPNFIQHHLAEAGGALSTYLRVLKIHVDSFDREILLRTLRLKIKDQLLQDIDPIFMYALSKILQVNCAYLRSSFNQHAGVFDLIDTLLSETNHA